MKIILDNNQHTPHLDFIQNVDGKDMILAQVSILKDGLYSSGDLNLLTQIYPKSDGILLVDLAEKRRKKRLTQ